MNYKTIDEILGKTIKTAREAQGISLTGFAKQLGTVKQTIFNYEKGIRSIPEDTFFSACKILGINPKKILKEALKAFTEETEKGLD